MTMPLWLLVLFAVASTALSAWLTWVLLREVRNGRRARAELQAETAIAIRVSEDITDEQVRAIGEMFPETEEIAQRVLKHRRAER